MVLNNTNNNKKNRRSQRNEDAYLADDVVHAVQVQHMARLMYDENILLNRVNSGTFYNEFLASIILGLVSFSLYKQFK